ncbi:MAG: ureidoglycolate lyase [Salinarimonas sp.]|nr:ureidoglycolate lyase [Salinarimonas sp.]
MTQDPILLKPQTASAEAFAPFGAMLGREIDFANADPERLSWHEPATDFRHEHDFNTGGGAPEFIWVRYRNPGPDITRLEMHLFTEQAVVPLTGAPIIHIVGRSLADAPETPDRNSLAAFTVPAGTGLCMAPGIWHASLAPNGEATCLMLTRRSTQEDLLSHLVHGSDARETRIVELADLGWPTLRIAL